MPAIVPIEDLRAAQKELIAARDLEELKRVLRDGAVLDGRISVNCGCRKA
jgi:hypothetical protein